MDKNPLIYILDTNTNSQEILNSYIKDVLPDSNILSYKNYEEGLSAIKNESQELIVFIDLDSHVDEKVLSEIKLKTNNIITMSLNYSTDLIVKAMRYGAKEFLTKPIIKEDLIRIIDALKYQDNDDNNSKIITIYSNKGGIGKTTIATNLAYELARTTHDKVALIDLNLQLGDIATFLNLSPAFDVSYVLNKLTEKREDTILQAFEKYNDTSLYVLSDPNYIEQAESIKPSQIDSFFRALKKVFSYIVIDISSNNDTLTLKILDNSDWILFTTIVNLPAIRNCQRCLNLFQSRHYPKDKIKIIINRYMENDEIKPEDIEIALGAKIYWKIPNNYFTIMEAINKGVSVNEINSSSNIANSFRDLAIKISDDIIKEALSTHRG